MSNIVTTSRTTLRDRSIEAYVGIESFFSALAQRARENKGQTAAEYMGVLLLVSVIIAAVVTSGIGDTIKSHLSTLVDDIFGGKSGKAS